MTDALILHTQEDCEHYINNYKELKVVLFSTHTSVDIYLKEKYGIRCTLITSLLDDFEIIQIRNRSSIIVDKILNELDIDISPQINSWYGLKLQYFQALYSYMCKIHLQAYISFHLGFSKIIKEHNFKKVYLYEWSLTDFFETGTKFSDLFHYFFHDLEIEIIKTNDRRGKSRIEKYIIRAKRIFKKLKNPLHFNFKSKIDLITKYFNLKRHQIISGRKSILLSEPLYALKDLLREIKNYNIIYYENYYSEYPYNFKNDNSDSFNINSIKWISEEKFDNPYEKICTKEIQNDFKYRISKYINPLVFLKSLIKNNQVILGIWGLPPVEKFRSLIFELLKTENVKILGMQHGCNYGEQLFEYHFDSDFRRCHYFISYGFNKEDLNRCFPNRSLNFKILPLGKFNGTKRTSARKTIDILFPITNNISVFEGGLIRLVPEKLVDRQIRILEFLDAYEKYDIYVKPFPNPSFKNCSVLPLFDRLRNLKIVDTIYLNKFLTYYHPRLVIIEYPSQPLYDVLGLDTEIFLMKDNINPYEQNALEELEKRVHYFEDVDEMIGSIDLFLNDKLEKKRDNAFYNHYVHKENTKENILKLIDDLVEDRKVD